jgi:hypothetical protein
MGKTGMRAGRSSDRGPSGAVVDGAGFLLVFTGKHSAHEARDRTLDATAQRRARVWEGARGQDSAAWDVAAGAGPPGRPPAGGRGLPPHAPACWQGAWTSGRSSARRRSAWRPDRSSGTPQSPWPYPLASAARNSRSHRSDSRRGPLSPPKVRRAEALRPQGKQCPCTPHVKRRRTSGSARRSRHGLDPGLDFLREELLQAVVDELGIGGVDTTPGEMAPDARDHA